MVRRGGPDLNSRSIMGVASELKSLGVEVYKKSIKLDFKLEILS